MDPEVALEERNPILSIPPGAASGSISIIGWQEFIGIPSIEVYMQRIQFMDLERKNWLNEGYQFETSN